MIGYQTGDLFRAGIPVLAHGVNLEGVMGSGIEAIAIPRTGAGTGGLKRDDANLALAAVAAGSPVRLVVVTLPEEAVK